MLDVIANHGFIVVVSLFGLGMIGAIIGRHHDHFANIWGNTLAILGSIAGIATSSAILITGHSVQAGFNLAGPLPGIELSLHIDRLAAFFILTICLIALCASIYALSYVREYYQHYSIGALGFFYNAFVLGMLLVVTASNMIWFLIAWEIMSITSYFLVIYDRNEPKNVHAGYVYLVMTHLGTACILLATILLAAYTHSFGFDAIRSNIHLMPPLMISLAFLLSFIGLGTKAGVIPFHIWLPSAHPAAPSHVSALMSGVMIKTGIYMMIRLFLELFGAPPLWWGIVVLVIGSISAILGVLYALTEHDIKRLLAYHSIENIGIILLGLGSALIFSSLHQPDLMLVALAAALFHTLNHAIFKSLLFLGAGSIIHATHTRNIESYGGLIKLMPATALFFLVGSMAISALPPFNGFFSEWYTYQALFSGIASTGYAKWAFLFAAGSLAITGGLALTCFVKAFGAAFLARPRSAEAEKAQESPFTMRLSMAGLALLCLIIGLSATPLFNALRDIAHQITTAPATPAASLLSSISSPIIALILTAGVLLTWLITRFAIRPSQKVTSGPTWDCGTPLNGRMEITATSFARSIILIFRGLLRPSLQHDIEYDDAASRYIPSSQKVTLSVRDVYQTYIYTPVYTRLFASSRFVKRAQNGNLNSYVLYILIALLIALMATL